MAAFAVGIVGKPIEDEHALEVESILVPECKVVSSRVVVNVELLGRAVAATVDLADVVPYLDG